MKFSDVPVVFKILNEEGLIPVQTIDDKLVVTNSEGTKYLFKENRGEEEKIFTVVFPEIRKQGLDFKVLVLPDILKVVGGVFKEGEKKKTDKFLILNFYEGESYNKKWNEFYPDGLGGRSVDPGLAEKMVGLLGDFAKIDLSGLRGCNLSEFDLETWRSRQFLLMRDKLIHKKIFSENHLRRVERALSDATLFNKSRKIITNGDFYPRNFIELKDGKMVVVDWEGRTDYEEDLKIGEVTEKVIGWRNAFVNYLENHAAFLFVHMWGNYAFGRKLMKRLIQDFGVEAKNIQAALLIKAMEQAYLWRDNMTHLPVDQAQILVNALDEQYINDLIS